MGYASVSFVLSIIKYFDATNAEIIKSGRKVLSIVISFVIYQKTLNWKYAGGFTLTVIAIVMMSLMKLAKKKAKDKAKFA